MNPLNTLDKHHDHLAHLLKTHYHAKGEGLDQQINSCQQRLPHELLPKLRFLARIRTKCSHGENVGTDELKKYHRLYKECDHLLTPRSHRTIWCLVFILICGVTLGSRLLY